MLCFASSDQPEDPLPKIPWSRDSFVEMLNEIKD